MKNLLRRVSILSIMLLLIQIKVHAAASYQMYTVQNKDSYWSIANKYNQTLNSIINLNNAQSDLLTQGQLVKVKPVKLISVKVDDRIINFDRQPYIENDRVFVPLRFISEALDVDMINWVASLKKVQIKKDSQTIEVTIGSNSATVNGRNILLDAPPSLYIDRTFVPIRFFTEALNVNDVSWDSKFYTVLVETKKKNLKKDYTYEELFWLSRIVHAESKGEPYSGKLAVANVVINRKNNSSFPDTIKDVIFDKKNGIQFSPVLNGSIYDKPSSESIMAAKEALKGKNNIGDCMFFLNQKIAESSWISENRYLYTRIANHTFYL